MAEKAGTPNAEIVSANTNKTTGKTTEGNVRGLLCRPCNTALGLFEDNPDLLRKAAEYVERKRKGIEPS